MKPWQQEANNKTTADNARLGRIILNDCYVSTRGNTVLSVKGTDVHDLVGLTLRNYAIVPIEQLALDVGDALFDYAESTGTLPDVMQWIESNS